MGGSKLFRYNDPMFLLHKYKSDLLALAGLLLLTLIFFWPVTLNLGWIPHGGGDLVSFLWPTYSYAAQSLHAGRIPLWNPTLYSGAPFAADNQSGLFYPINLLTFLLVPSLPYAAMEWLVVFHVWLAGASMYFLMRVLLSEDSGTRITPKNTDTTEDEKRSVQSEVVREIRVQIVFPALFSAIAYMFSDVFIMHIGHLNIVAVSAWLPAAFAALHLGLTRRSPGWSAGAGVILGLAVLAGHAQMTLIITVGLGLYAIWYILIGSEHLTLNRLRNVILRARSVRRISPGDTSARPSTSREKASRSAQDAGLSMTVHPFLSAHPLRAKRNPLSAIRFAQQSV